MTYTELKSVLESTGMPVTYRTWPVGQAPRLPYICYLADYSDNFGADNIAYFPIMHTRIELYTQNKDVDAEAKVEMALTSALLFWQKSETYIDSENCYQITYETGV